MYIDLLDSSLKYLILIGHLRHLADGMTDRTIFIINLIFHIHELISLEVAM